MKLPIEALHDIIEQGGRIAYVFVPRDIVYKQCPEIERVLAFRHTMQTDSHQDLPGEPDHTIKKDCGVLGRDIKDLDTELEQEEWGVIKEIDNIETAANDLMLAAEKFREIATKETIAKKMHLEELTAKRAEFERRLGKTKTKTLF